MSASPLDPYFAALDAGDDDAAAAAFSEEAQYIRPALQEGGQARGVEVLRGRASIRAFFDRRRGLQKQGEYAHRHDIRSAAVDGPQCFVEGLMVADTGPVGVFLSHATLDDDGLISRYIAVFTATPDGFDAVPD